MNKAAAAVAGAPPERRAGWLLELGRLRQRRDREAALATLDRLVREHPKSNDAPDALLLKADILETAARPAEAGGRPVRRRDAGTVGIEQEVGRHHAEGPEHPLPDQITEGGAV